jgi:hypothetical protein
MVYERDDPPAPDVPSAEIRPGGAATGLVVKLIKGAEIDVLVTDPAATPLAGASVSWVMPGEELANGFGPAKRPRVIATDDSGRARLKGIARKGGIVVAARHQRFPAGGEATVDASSPPREPVKIVLAPGASVAGVVTDVDGRPAADRIVIFMPSRGDVARAFAEGNWNGVRVTTDSAGRFLIEHAPSGEATLDVEEKRAERPPGAVYDERPDCLEGGIAKVTLVSGKRQDVRLQLLATQDIRGRVFDAEGKPLANQWIAVNIPGGNPIGGGQSGADGAYRVGGLAPGDYEVVANATSSSPEVPPERLTKIVRAGAHDVDFRFTR